MIKVNESWYDLCFNGVSRCDVLPDNYSVVWENKIDYFKETILLNRIDAICRMSVKVRLTDLLKASLGMNATTCTSFVGAVLGVDLPHEPYKAVRKLTKLKDSGIL